jgi:hypothetical protein
MKAILLACVLLGLAAQSYAEEADVEQVHNNEARFFFFNSTGSAQTLSLVGATILILVIGYLVFASVSTTSNSYYNRNDFEQYDPYAETYGQYNGQYRSAPSGFFDGMNIIQWVSMLQDVYEKFDYNDLDCQKRLICEVMREPDYYGSVAKKFKTGFQYAKYLEVLDLPDDMRELLDEYMDANSRADQQKTCDEFFTCPYSIRDSMKRNIADTNNL